MSLLTLETGVNCYPIYICEDIIDASFFRALLKNYQELCLITNQTLEELYKAQILKPFKKILAETCPAIYYHQINLPDGEQYKTIESWSYILTQMLSCQFSRKVLVVAFGGGVVGDMAGFAASCYQRGVDFIQLPTTLLAMVDSSVGGKTAINHPLGKNMIGAFYQPKAVFIDPYFLKDLPEREYKAGLAEVVKYGFILDKSFLDFLVTNKTKVFQRDASLLSQIIYKSCQYKANIVAKDEREGGVRAILNFGHTFAHAFEKVLGYGRLRHGEAVSIGMRAALLLSYKLGLLPLSVYQEGLRYLIELHLPTVLPSLCDEGEILEAMQQDKKRTAKNLNFIVLDKLGHALIVTVADLALIKSVIQACYTVPKLEGS